MGNSTWTALGTVAGGVGGFIVGGPAGAFAGATAGAGLGGGVDGRAVAYGNADEFASIGVYNANTAIINGEYNARSIEAIGLVQGFSALIGANAAADAEIQIAELNAGIQRQVSNYNADQQRYDAQLIWDQAGLDKSQFNRRMENVYSDAEAQYGASGVLLDVAGDTPDQILLDMHTEASLELMIMDRNADVSARKMLDAASLSVWEGETMARKFLFEGYTKANLTRMGGQISAASSIAGSKLNAEATRWSSRIEADNIIRNANWNANQSRQSGDQALVSGMLNAATSIAFAYGVGTFGSGASTGIKSSTAVAPAYTKLPTASGWNGAQVGLGANRTNQGVVLGTAGNTSLL